MPIFRFQRGSKQHGYINLTDPVMGYEQKMGVIHSLRQALVTPPESYKKMLNEDTNSKKGSN